MSVRRWLRSTERSYEISPAWTRLDCLWCAVRSCCRARDGKEPRTLVLPIYNLECWRNWWHFLPFRMIHLSCRGMKKHHKVSRCPQVFSRPYIWAYHSVWWSRSHSCAGLGSKSPPRTFLVFGKACRCYFVRIAGDNSTNSYQGWHLPKSRGDYTPRYNGDESQGGYFPASRIAGWKLQCSRSHSFAGRIEWGLSFESECSCVQVIHSGMGKWL